MNRRRYRLGFTLIELIAVMVGVSTVISITSMMICLAFDLSLKNEEQIQTRRSQERLLAAFRQDVARFGKPEIESTTAEASETRTPLSWNFDRTSLIYQIVPADRSTVCVDRIESEEGKPPRRETFVLPDDIRIDVYQGTGDDERLIALSLWRSPLPEIRLTHDDLNPFSGEISETLARQVDPRFAVNWQTAIVRLPAP